MFGAFRKLGGLAKKLGPVAPVAAQILKLSPWPGPMASAAIQKVAEAVGGNPEDPGSVEAALDRATTDQVVALRMRDSEIKAELDKAEIDLAKLRIRDVADARRAHSGNAFMPWIGSFLLAIFVGAVTGVFWLFREGVTDPVVLTTMGTVLGYCAGMAQSVATYYFGSSQGEAERRATE